MTSLNSALSIVALATGSDEALLSTLHATAATLAGQPFECLVVANGVNFNPKRLSALPLQATVLQCAERVHPGAILNSAVAHAHNEFVAFLPAGALPQPYWYSGAVSALRKSGNLALVVPRLLDAAGTRVRSCGTGLKAGHLSPFHAGAPANSSYVLRPTMIDMAPLHGAVFRRAHFEVVSGFDAAFAESLFDVDWSLRARLKGLAVLYRPDVTIRYDGAIALGGDPAERASAEHFLSRWQNVFKPSLSPEAFLP
jgi:hypothetical protein